MKNLKNYLIALAFLLHSASAQAQVYGPTSASGSVSGASIVGTGGTTETLPTTSDTLAGLAATQTLTNKTYTNPIVTGTFTGSGMPLGVPGASFTANPLMQMGFYDVLVGSANTPTANNLIASATSRQIIPLGAGISIMALGTGAGATGVAIVCTGVPGTTTFGNTIVSVPVAALVSNVAVTPYMVASAVTYGSAINRGCPVGQGVMVSTIGSALTTTTDLFVQFPYIVQ